MLSMHNTEYQIWQAMIYKRTNMAALARLMGISRSNLHRKMKRNTLRKEDLCRIAKALGGEYVSYFAFPGSVKIGDSPVRTAKSRE